MKKAVFVLMLLVSTIVVAGDLEDGIEALEQDDYATALAKFKPLAKQGDAEAQYYLGRMYDFGWGVRHDFKQAVHWYRKAADQGNEYGQFGLAAAYHYGHGVPRDKKQEMYWLTKAAEGGQPNAQYNLGTMYEQGRGVPRDYVQAHFWLSVLIAQDPRVNFLTARGKDAEKTMLAARARSVLKSLEENMTPEQIEEAKRRASQWKPKKE